MDQTVLNFGEAVKSLGQRQRQTELFERCVATAEAAVDAPTAEGRA